MGGMSLGRWRMWDRMRDGVDEDVMEEVMGRASRSIGS